MRNAPFITSIVSSKSSKSRKVVDSSEQITERRKKSQNGQGEKPTARCKELKGNTSICFHEAGSGCSLYPELYADCSDKLNSPNGLVDGFTLWRWNKYIFQAVVRIFEVSCRILENEDLDIQ